jgi:hypothetical protein
MAATGALTLNYSCPFPLLGAQDMTVSISVDGLPDAAVAGVPTSEAHVVATATVGGGPRGVSTCSAPRPSRAPRWPPPPSTTRARRSTPPPR